MNRAISILLLTSILLSSCATILNGKYQKVIIDTDSETTVLVNGKDPQMKKGKYKLKRDAFPKQITFKKEGFKNENIVPVQYKLAPIRHLTWLFFIFPGIFDAGYKARNYDKKLTVPELKKLPVKTEEMKEITVLNILSNIDTSGVEYTIFKRYPRYTNEAVTKKSVTKSMEIKPEFLQSDLNNVLKDQGFIDTTKLILKNSFGNNAYLKASIENIEIRAMKRTRDGMNSTYKIQRIYHADVTINWELLDYYKEPIYTYTTEVKTGEYIIDHYRLICGDALQTGLIELFEQEDFLEKIKKSDTNKEFEEMEDITLATNQPFVENASQAIQSSVTVKNKNGHGSGFIISSDGYILTNYHVISKKEELQVVMNSKDIFDFEIVRVDKQNDLALLKIDTTNLVPFKLNSESKIKLATDIFAVGTPSAVDLSQSISQGIISGIRKGDNQSKLIQTDASINGGNSGGAIINKEGLVLGIVKSKVKGIGVEGVAFGIPANIALEKLKLNYAK